MFINSNPKQQRKWQWDHEIESESEVAQSCLILCDPMDYTVHGILQAGVGSRSLLQQIFPTQGSNPGLPHCKWILYQLSTREAQE